jgi:hypothetical protein
MRDRRPLAVAPAARAGLPAESQASPQHRRGPGRSPRTRPVDADGQGSSPSRASAPTSHPPPTPSSAHIWPPSLQVAGGEPRIGKKVRTLPSRLVRR